MNRIVRRRITMDITFLKNTFCISRKKIGFNDALNAEVELSRASLYFHDDTDIFKCSKDEKSLYVIGYILDIREGNRNIGDISDRLLESFYKSEEEFYDELKLMNGRFVLIFESANDTCMYNYANSMRPVYQWKKKIFGSYEIVDREIVETEKNIKLEKFKNFMNCFLDFSNTRGIYKFNPKLYFSFKEED